MKNVANKIQALQENYKANEAGLSLREYVESEADSDPNFFRWLFSEELEQDFDSSLTAEQKEEYQKFLNELPNDIDVINQNPFGNIEGGVILKVIGADSESAATSAVEEYLRDNDKEEEVGYDASVSEEEGVFFVRLVDFN